MQKNLAGSTGYENVVNTDRKRLGTEGVPHDGGIESLWSV